MINYKQKAKELRKGFEGMLPVPIEEIAKREGIKVKYGSLEGDMSGFLFSQKKEIVIGINAFHPPTRQRFTLAHELGHLFLKHQGEFFVDRQVIYRDYRSGLGIDQSEKEANGFAAELLMPEDEVRSILLKNDVDLENEEDVQQIADIFGVSKQAMTYRIVNLFNH